MKYHVRYMAVALPLLFPALGAGQNKWSAPDVASNVMDSTTVARLLVKPACLATCVDSIKTYVVEDVPVRSKGIVLSGQLYLPAHGRRWPLMILYPGGFNETELIMRAPRYYAPRLAHCGFAAYVYWKRGTGPSGVYAEATNDDCCLCFSVSSTLAIGQKKKYFQLHRPDSDTMTCTHVQRMRSVVFIAVV